MNQISEETKRRYAAFWDRTDVGRACISIDHWDGSPGYRAPSSADEQWGDISYREEKTVYEMNHVSGYYEWIPSQFVNFGPGSLTACIGGSYRFAPDTVWFENEPLFIEDWDTCTDPVLNTDSAMYQMTDKLTARFLKHKDLFITSITDIGGTMDIVAALRGTQNLLYDMYDNPDKVTALRKKVAAIWRTYYLHYADMLIREQGCMTSWMPIWSDRTYYPLQCDYSAMISPAMFREFVLPDLEYQTGYMERSIYHLDGPGELPHLDMLLSMKRLNAIQWTSGEGKPSLGDDCWIELYQRIQKAGKGLVLLGIAPEQMNRLFRKISQRGVYAITWARDKQEADEIIAMCEQRNREFNGTFGR